MVHVSVQVLVLLALVAKSLCLPGGAPTSACSNLTPSHGASSQDGETNPYVLNLTDFPRDSAENYFYVPGVTYTGVYLYISTRPDRICMHAVQSLSSILYLNLNTHACTRYCSVSSRKWTNF